MFKKRKFKVLIAALAAVLAIGITAFAKQATETISVMYDNIKILIDGVEYTPKDANGNLVEPFVYNGTTYLPVRAVANAFDKDVDWEPQTSTVVLGSKNYDWLDQMGYAKYETTGTSNHVATISQKTQMSDGMIYDRGFIFHLGICGNGARKLNNEKAESWQSIEYLLNGNYKNFTGVIVAAGSERLAQPAIIKVYGDGGLIYTSPLISDGTKSTDFSVDVSNYKVLKIVAELPNFNYYSDTDYNYMHYRNCGIADARLAKK